ncbi:DUF2510 domain-containing protein [Kitasatospora sp. NPDC059599]|uniref:DUF2510 domain-containing protein n=1 Tax=Kitasatospora sp. NPDC059599 TaxID=3346880 RepID=UPI00369DEE60
MSEQIPAGWYPDPKDTTGDPRPQRWWDGKGWTADTRPAPSDAPEPAAPAADASAPGTPQTPDVPAAPETGEPGPGTAEQPTVLEGEVLESGPTVRYPEPPPFGAAFGSPVPPRKARRKPSKLVVATVVAALLGLGAGSGITYLAMDGGSDSKPTAQHTPRGSFGPWDGYPGNGGNGGNGGGNGGSGDSKGNGKGNGGNGNGKVRPGSDAAIDMVNKLTLPVPNGWQAETTRDGYAMITVGSYACPDGSGDCTLGGVNTGRIDGGGTDVQAAAKADIAATAKSSYGDITGHQELKSEAVKVNGQDGYLVRWKVDAPKGNNGYVQTVVFPSADGKALVSVHFGFDIADKAPDVAVMDTVVKGITDYKGKLPSIPGMPGTGGAPGSGAGPGAGAVPGAGGTGGTTT